MADLMTFQKNVPMATFAFDEATITESLNEKIEERKIAIINSIAVKR